jgi:hypothetical protein
LSTPFPSSNQPARPTYSPDKEYVAASGFFSTKVGTALASLFSDDAELALGIGGYERLLTDPEIHKDITLLVDAILGDGVQLFPNFTDEKSDAPKAKLAAELSDFCHLNLFETPQRPLRETLNEAVKFALVTGHKVVEQTYRDYTDETGRPRLVLDKLKCKPRYTAQFVVDSFLNILGLEVWTGANRQLVPREKFFIPTFDRKDEDPRGTAPAMRAIYNWWLAKRTGLPIFVKRIEKKAVPSMAGFTAPDEGNTDVTDSQGNAVNQTPQEAMANTLSDLDSMTAAAFAYGAKVEVLDAAGNGDEFKSFFEICDRQITRAILLQDLATNEGQHGTRAQSVTHMDILSLRIWNLKNTVADCLRNDVCKQVVGINYGPDKVSLTPAVSMGDTDRRDWATDAAAAALLGPYVPDSIFAAMCQQLGLPMPDEGEEWPTRAKSNSNSVNGQPGEGTVTSLAEAMALHRNLASALRAARSLRASFKEAA